ncbi:GntR family transcriptional regulator [Arthrobacter sp. ISL-65]|uniref:GntR family transcriptional regulator n=1 Tax=Arthrobacter sp. ISL-65 TaxID=2819112 RepID=UPI001BE6961B|nr:GntR family transcriptional regulator [Arthrobacter sp. ISL-65]MBT2548737.1 GntR family transcriptional regulator [Arthrobacter sp. ISL-65]
MTADIFPGQWKPNTGSSVALFEQLRLHVIEQADQGKLAPGTRLPAVRSLAGILGVAPHTVARAYKELEAAGVVATKGRNGTVVCARDERWGALSEAASDYAAAAKSQGATFAQAVHLLAAAYDAE